MTQIDSMTVFCTMISYSIELKHIIQILNFQMTQLNGCGIKIRMY